jgi:UDP-glucose 4-epimerase
MMTLEEAVELVLYAFEHAGPGDIFVQKSPAATIEVLAKAMLELYKANNSIKIIGTRHGEKQFETLVNREEMVKAKDLGKYFRIPADTRDLNYNRYFSNGESQISEMEEYNSHNTHLLDIEETKKLLLKLPLIQKDILGEEVEEYPD